MCMAESVEITSMEAYCIRVLKYIWMKLLKGNILMKEKNTIENMKSRIKKSVNYIAISHLHGLRFCFQAKINTTKEKK